MPVLLSPFDKKFDKFDIFVAESLSGFSAALMEFSNQQSSTDILWLNSIPA